MKETLKHCSFISCRYGRKLYSWCVIFESKLESFFLFYISLVCVCVCLQVFLLLSLNCVQSKFYNLYSVSDHVMIMHGEKNPLCIYGVIISYKLLLLNVSTFTNPTTWPAGNDGEQWKEKTTIYAPETV